MTHSAGNDIRERIVGLLTRIARRPLQINDTTTLIGDLGFESVQVLELVVAVEQAFDIMIDTDHLEPIHTVADLQSAIEALMARS